MNYSPSYWGWNFFNWFTMNSPLSARAEIQGMLDFAGSKSLIFQEIGFPAGYTSQPSGIDSSLAEQAEFFDILIEMIASEPRLRGAIVFQMMDWSPAWVQFVADFFAAEGIPQYIADRYGEQLATTGFFRFTDGSTRPAWSNYLSGLAIYDQGFGSLVFESTAIVPGSSTTFTVEGAQPGATIEVVYSVSGLGLSLAPSVSATLAISNPRSAFLMIADALGQASTSVVVPIGAAGRKIWLQSAETGNTSGLIFLDL